MRFSIFPIFAPPFHFSWSHFILHIFRFLQQQFLAFVCLTVRCFVARFICINMMLIFMISIMFHYAAFYDTSGSVCSLFRGFRRGFFGAHTHTHVVHIGVAIFPNTCISRFVSALIYGPFVYRCVYIV